MLAETQQTQDGMREVVIKLRPSRLDVEGRVVHPPRAVLEIEVYNAILRQEANARAAAPDAPFKSIVPQLYRVDLDAEWSAMMMERVGTSLEEAVPARKEKGEFKKVPLDKIAHIAPQMVRILQAIHSTGWVYKGCHPGNFLLAKPEESSAEMGDWEKIYVIDFERAVRWNLDGVHMPFKIYPEDEDEPARVGGEELTFGDAKVKPPSTPTTERYYGGRGRFKGFNAYKRYELSRRDDMEAMWYMLVWLAREEYLPWEKIKDEEVSHKMKLEWTPERLCEGLPPAWITFIEYVRGLGFEEEPNYDYLCELCKGLKA